MKKKYKCTIIIYLNTNPPQRCKKHVNLFCLMISTLITMY